jgi:hypothetical protein
MFKNVGIDRFALLIYDQMPLVGKKKTYSTFNFQFLWDQRQTFFFAYFLLDCANVYEQAGEAIDGSSF